jgi:broad specificity phosphatase PhoE
MDIYFIRHGQYDTLRRDAGCLTSMGRFQARMLGEKFLGEKKVFDGIYCSTLPRARETASVCCGEMKIPFGKVVCSERLVEERAFFEGYDEVVERMQGVVDDILTDNEASNIAVFSHGMAIRYLMQAYCSNDKEREFFVMPHCGVQLVDYRLEDVGLWGKKGRKVWRPDVSKEYDGENHILDIMSYN